LTEAEQQGRNSEEIIQAKWLFTKRERKESERYGDDIDDGEENHYVT
jgi:hypothetical protein